MVSHFQSLFEKARGEVIFRHFLNVADIPVDIERELNVITDCSPPGEEARVGKSFSVTFCKSFLVTFCHCKVILLEGRPGVVSHFPSLFVIVKSFC